MLNPSDAGEHRDDPTSLRVTRFTAAWGYDGWIGVNVYPFVASRPADMWRRADWPNNGPDWEARDNLAANLHHIETVARHATLRVLAFGAAPISHDAGWLEQCIEAFSQPSNIDSDNCLWCLGVNQTGQPLHPMARGKWRVPDSQQPLLWKAAEYHVKGDL